MPPKDSFQSFFGIDICLTSLKFSDTDTANIAVNFSCDLHTLFFKFQHLLTIPLRYKTLLSI